MRNRERRGDPAADRRRAGGRRCAGGAVCIHGLAQPHGTTYSMARPPAYHGHGARSSYARADPHSCCPPLLLSWLIFDIIVVVVPKGDGNFRLSPGFTSLLSGCFLLFLRLCHFDHGIGSLGLRTSAGRWWISRRLPLAPIAVLRVRPSRGRSVSNRRSRLLLGS